MKMLPKQEKVEWIFYLAWRLLNSSRKTESMDKHDLIGSLGKQDLVGLNYGKKKFSRIKTGSMDERDWVGLKQDY